MKAMLMAAGLVAMCLGLAGCEDEGDQTIVNNEAPVYQTGSNGHPVVVVADNDGTVAIDLTTGEETPYDVFVNNNGSNGNVAITVGPVAPVAPVPEPGAP
jgi:hypothetical protein